MFRNLLVIVPVKDEVFFRIVDPDNLSDSIAFLRQEFYRSYYPISENHLAEMAFPQQSSRIFIPCAIITVDQPEKSTPDIFPDRDKTLDKLTYRQIFF
jgi:hypothetical protein